MEYTLLGAFILMATLCKEQGITVVGICALYDLILVQQVQ